MIDHGTLQEVREEKTRARQSTSRCLVCGSPERVALANSVRGSRFSLLRCSNCLLQYLDPFPSWEEIKGQYTADYYKAWGMAEGEDPAVADLKRATFNLRCRELQQYRGTGRILDVGTASGFFLETAHEFGHDVYGVELSEYSARLAQAKFGADRIHLGTLETAPFPKASFRAVAMSDLLEHVPSPMDTLRLAWEFLEPNGVLMIMTPDTASPTNKIMGTSWTHYKLEHLSYWNPAVMRRAAEETGFRVLNIRRAKKCMNLAYLGTQLDTYPNPILTPLARVARAIAGPLRTSHFRISMGELVAFLQKVGS